MYNNFNKSYYPSMATQTHQTHQTSFDTHLHQAVLNHLESSACFFIKLEDNTETFLSLPQTALVQDLYRQIELRYMEQPYPKCLYTDNKRSVYIPNCDESLETMVAHFNMHPISPSTSSVPVFRLYLTVKPQHTTSTQYNPYHKRSSVSASSTMPNLTINGTSIPSNYAFK